MKIKDDKDIIKMGDKVLMQIIFRGGVVMAERASFCFLLNNRRYVYWNGYMLKIEEMLGTHITKLDDKKHKDIIDKYTTKTSELRIHLHGESPFLPWRFERRLGEMLELSPEQNQLMFSYLRKCVF